MGLFDRRVSHCQARSEHRLVRYPMPFSMIENVHVTSIVGGTTKLNGDPRWLGYVKEKLQS